MTISEEMRMKVLDAVNEHWRQHHMAPSIRELTIAVDCNSTSVMRVALDDLEEEGLIRRDDKKARTAIPKWVDRLFSDAVTTYQISDDEWGLYSGGEVIRGYQSQEEAESAGWDSLYRT